MASIETDTIPGRLSTQTTWEFLARDEERIRSLARLAMVRRRELRLPPNAIFVRRPPPEVVAHTPLWTDDYSDLFRVLRPIPVRITLE